jgi:hypothetical protein
LGIMSFEALMFGYLKINLLNFVGGMSITERL